MEVRTALCCAVLAPASCNATCANVLLGAADECWLCLPTVGCLHGLPVTNVVPAVWCRRSPTLTWTCAWPTRPTSWRCRACRWQSSRVRLGWAGTWALAGHHLNYALARCTATRIACQLCAPLPAIHPTRLRTAALPHAAIAIVAGKMLVYPNEFSLPLMPNFGLPPPPQGMLHVKVGARAGKQAARPTGALHRSHPEAASPAQRTLPAADASIQMPPLIPFSSRWCPPGASSPRCLTKWTRWCSWSFARGAAPRCAGGPQPRARRRPQCSAVAHRKSSHGVAHCTRCPHALMPRCHCCERADHHQVQQRGAGVERGV